MIMEKLHILQFECDDDILIGTRAFLRVHNKFKHHYTGETMRCVQIDYMDDGEANTFFTVMNEADFEAYYERRIKEDEYAEEKNGGDD